MNISPLPGIIARLRGVSGGDNFRRLNDDELASIGMGEMPTVRHGALPAQRRVHTAIAALGELMDAAELELALRSLAARKGPVWAANLLRRAADDVECRK